MRYFISAGHHPAAPGAVNGVFVEHDEAVLWQDTLCELLGDFAVRVPVGVLRTKVDFINARVLDGDVAIEIHFNAAQDENGTPVGRGCETLHYPGSQAGIALAHMCQDVMSEFYAPDRGVKEGWYRLDPSRGPNFFLARTRCPAVIIEPEFVHRYDIIRAKKDNFLECLSKVLKGADHG